MLLGNAIYRKETTKPGIKIATMNIISFKVLVYL